MVEEIDMEERNLENERLMEEIISGLEQRKYRDSLIEELKQENREQIEKEYKMYCSLHSLD